MEPIIAIVGFLGAGKTTLLKFLIKEYQAAGWNPYVILNDYENADVDAQQLTQESNPDWISGLSGSCICCSGIAQLRDTVNGIPKRDNGVTLIEANGTSDAVSLMGFLGVGMDSRFLPPVQVSVVDVANWQKRGEHDELETNQVQVSSLIVLSHLEEVDKQRRDQVVRELKSLNPSSEIVTSDELLIEKLVQLSPSSNTPDSFEHAKSHWSSCSVELPTLPTKESLEKIIEALPKSLLRVKGFCKIMGQDGYTFFERTPDTSVFTRPYNGVPIMNASLLVVGPGSDPDKLQGIVQKVLT